MTGFFRRYTNFTIFLLTMLLTGGVAATLVPPARALLIGFDAGALLFLALSARLFDRAGAARLRQRAAENEPDHGWLTLFALVVVAVVLTAVGTELSGRGGRQAAGIALGAGTLSLAWLFANLLAAIHYAHLWYSEAEGGDAGGIAFPGGDTTPDYWDFAYFAFTIGMTFQVSDAVITARPVRRAALLHAVIAFLYNIAVIALSVSLIASVLGG